ncbi:MAG: hypothetical protein B7Z10_00130 [Rhodobacterales bacterium 32-66-7]|nr:MAG: hypothetical protein B7Z31_03805 [Rhodobacterales bacterium 12-65-15]OYX27519.1 MAG: hypothetical protein B7Z10_00130 [Rhodobacterales bacterium 32-66-7]
MLFLRPLALILAFCLGVGAAAQDLVMDVNLWGGVSLKNLDDTFDWWRVILDLVREEFPEDPDAPGQTTGPTSL